MCYDFIGKTREALMLIIMALSVGGLYAAATIVAAVWIWCNVVRVVGMADSYTRGDRWRVRYEYYVGGTLISLWTGLQWPRILWRRIQYRRILIT